METLEAGGHRLGYRHEAGATGITFVFINALTGAAAQWEQAIAPALRGRGHGTLSFDLPGQAWSPLQAEQQLTPADLSAAVVGVVRALGPSQPVYVGLSIGGLFALQAHLTHGSPAAGFVLVNTLRKPSARLAWINDAVLRLAELGGTRLLKDVYGPLLLGRSGAEGARAEALTSAPYEALPATAAECKLLAAGAKADWSFAYEDVRVPVVVLSGLDDHVFFDAADVAELAVRLPDAVRIDLPRGGHLLPAEAPDAVVRACLSVVGRIGEA